MRYREIRLCILGFGSIAEKHLEVFRALRADVCASCNRSEEGRTRARVKGGIPKTYADLLEMVEREKPDGLLVTVSAISLAEVARQVIPLGIPVLLEKPPGLSLAETEELARLVLKTGTKVMVGLNRRFYSVYHRALDAMGGREAVTGVAVEWSEDPILMRELGYPEEVIRGLNFANSLHGIDLLPFFGGAKLAGQARGRVLPGGLYRWQMAFDGESERGALLYFASSWDVPGRWRLVVDAPDVRMVSAPLESAALLRRGKAAEEIAPSDEDRRFKPGFHGQAKAFLEAVWTGEAPPWPACSLDEACISMRVADQLNAACEGRA